MSKKKIITEEKIVDDPILDEWKKDELVEIPRPVTTEDLDEEDIDELLEKPTKEKVADPIPDVAQVEREEAALSEERFSEIEIVDETSEPEPVPSKQKRKRNQTQAVFDLCTAQFEAVGRPRRAMAK